MVFVCNDFNELKLVIRSVLTATKSALNVEELWLKVLDVFGGGPNYVQLKVFDFSSFDELLKSIPDIVQLEDPTDTNSLVNLVSSELSCHIEHLVVSNIRRPISEKKNKHFCNDILVPYQVQCAFIRIFMELYPEGLCITDFESDVLCMPIFKSFNDSVDRLLYGLYHIFKRIEMDMITIQPTIVNSVKNLKEKDKFGALDIYNIEEFMLGDSNYDCELAEGLEYPLSIILEDSIRKNIELLLDENPNGILERQVCDFYIRKFGSSFSHFRRWGFVRVSLMFAKLPEICCVHFLNEEIELVSKKNHICDVNKKTNVIEKVNELEYIIPVKGKTDYKPNENDEVLYKFLKNDSLLLASLNDCFLDQKFQYVELKINTLLDVNICRVNMDILPTIICQVIDESFELKTLLNKMNSFYFLNESKFMFERNAIKINHIYAVFDDNSWFRGSVIDVQYDKIKIMNVDNGFIHTILSEDIRLLHKQFSQLPAQAFTCFLAGIMTIDENVLVQIVDKKCTIYIVSVDHHSKIAYIKIKLCNSTSVWLNDEWIKNGSAEPDDESDPE